MNRVLYSGKHLNETELKRINTILQSQAATIWASVRTYSFIYQKGRKSYYDSYSAGSESLSDWDSTSNTINQTFTELSNKNVEGLAEATAAAQAAQQAAKDDQSSQVNEEEAPKAADDVSVAEIIDGLPDEPSTTPTNEPSGLSGEQAIAVIEANDAAEKAAEAAQQATNDWKEAAQAANAARDDANAVVDVQASGGSTTYTDVNGNEHTYSNNGSTATLTGYEHNGQTGTLTTGPDGSWFTPDGGGEPVSVTGVNASSEAYTQASERQEQANAERDEKGQEMVDANRANAEAQQNATNTYNEAAKEAYENDRDPDSGNGGYSESDSSTWSDPSYDSSEWGGF